MRVREAKGYAREQFRVGRVAGSVGSREKNLDLASEADIGLRKARVSRRWLGTMGADRGGRRLCSA